MFLLIVIGKVREPPKVPFNLKAFWKVNLKLCMECEAKCKAECCKSAKA